MSPSETIIHDQLAVLDGRISTVTTNVLAGDDQSTGLNGPAVSLVAAISAAAFAASKQSEANDLSTPLSQRKELVDGAATTAAEQVFSKADLNIRVTAGEGARDHSPGATTGQLLGSIGSGEPLDGVFDYVDGTELAARRQPGALALGGLGVGLRPVPDLQAYAVLAPRSILAQLDIMSPPEEHAVSVLNLTADALGKPASDLTVLTHSLWSNQAHRSLIAVLESVAGAVIVPEGVTIEPPYLLSLVGMSEPRIDAMIGAIGLSELAFAATLIDLLTPDYGFVFRCASIQGPRSAPNDDRLDAMFSFDDHEISALRDTGWEVDRQYLGSDIVPAGAGRAAAIFAVTDNPILGLAGPCSSSAPQAQGVLVEPGRKITEITVRYEA